MTTMLVSSKPASKVDAQPAGWLGGDRAVRLAILLVCGIGGGLALLSNGGYMDDEVTHYLIARTAWERPALLLDEWGRPGFTVPYAAVAWLGSVEAGFAAARMLSVALLGGSAWLTWRVARELGVRHAAAAPLLLLAMPLNFFVSFTTTTETIAAFYAIAATWLLLRGRRWAAAAVLALLPLTRHELVLILVPIGLYFLWRRDFVAALLLVWAEAMWNALVWAMSLYPPSGKLPIERFLSTADAGILGYGAPWHYLLRWIEMSGMVIVALAAVGAATLVWRGMRRYGFQPAAALRDLLGQHEQSFEARARRVRLLIIGGAMSLVALHTWLYLVNTHLSGGYARFLIPGAPWMAICAAWGTTQVIRTLRTCRMNVPVRWVLVILAAAAVISLAVGIDPLISRIVKALLLGAILLILVHPRRRLLHACVGLALAVLIIDWIGAAQPHRLTPDQIQIRRTLAALQTSHPQHALTGSSPWIQYFLDQPVNLPRWHDPLPWDPQNHPVKMLYLFDLTHGKPFVLEAMSQLPHRRILHIEAQPESAGPLSVYERLK